MQRADEVLYCCWRRRRRGGDEMHRRLHDTGRLRRYIILIPSLCLLLGLSFAAPAGAVSAHPAADRQQATITDIISTTRTYAEQFYPLWFTHAQYGLAPHNQLIGPDRISPLYQAVVAINNDTLYASTVIDLTAGPVIVTVPGTRRGSFAYSVLLLDPYGNIYPSGIPSKPAGAQTRRMVYALVAPGYTGKIPRRATRVTMPLDIMGLIFRADRYSGSTDQTSQASAFRAALRLQPLAAYMKHPRGGATQVVPEVRFAVPFKTIADTLIRLRSIAFLSQLQTAVHSDITPPLTSQEKALSDKFDALFGSGGSGLTPAARAAFVTGARAAHDAIVNNYLGNRGPNNWIHFTNIGNWGDQVLDRASITEFIQFGNGISTAAYYHTFRDGSGAPLVGSTPHGYVMTFKPGGAPPAERFWSLTAYTPNSIELIPNPANKYLVASYTPGLRKNRDGSISIYISRTKPVGVPAANWLPVSSRPFNVMLRVYGVKPGSSVANNTYVPPPVVKNLIHP
jgi:hypothetical protein